MKYKHKKIEYSVGALLIATSLFVAGFSFSKKDASLPSRVLTVQEKEDPNTRLVLEIFDSIKTNYWNTVDENKLMQLFALATSKVASTTVPSSFLTREDFARFIHEALSTKQPADKKTATLTIGELVLSNLEPFGRSHLFTLAQEKNLRDTVSNINNDKDLYAAIGVTKDASTESIEKEYEKKAAVLAKEKTPEAQAKMKELEHIKDTLTDDKKKALYDTQKIEPTFYSKKLSASTYYLNMTKFSPTSLQEFADEIVKITKDPRARELILDMRGNIGGSLDIVPYLSGLFIGPGQYAFDLYKQGNYIPFKTPIQKLPELARFKKVIVLIDGNTQSSAELFTSVVKKYNKAIVVGTHSKGWGTIENTFPVETSLDGEKYSLFLVHSITIRDDGQPIEGRGVDPDIDITNKNWRDLASDMLNDKTLVTLLEQVLKNRP